MSISTAEARELLGLKVKEKKRSKYGAVKTKVDGITFDSKAEAARYELNKIRIATGELSYQLLQVPFTLPANVKYRCDFLEVYSDGTLDYVDVKGMVTPTFKLKKKQVEALYPVEIHCVKLSRNNFIDVDI